MAVVNLCQSLVNNIICPEGKKKANYFDASINGFIVESRCSGLKTYALRYKAPNGRQRQYKIGSTKEISFDKAKKKAAQILSRVVLGEDPSGEKHIKKQVPTFSEFTVASYLPFIDGYKREGSIKADLSMLENHLLPRFGDTPLDLISQPDVIEFHQGMIAKGLAKGTANRGLVLLKHILNMALKWKTPGVTTNPAVGVKLFEANNARERYLTPEETQRLMGAIQNSRNKQLKYIVPLLLLLGCRKQELLGSRWEEFDLEKRSWRIPMSKSGKSRHVPLSKAVLEILAQLPRFDGCPYVVPNPDTLKPFVQIHRGWDNARIAAGLPDVRMHDLRHSMASNMVNSGRSIYEVQSVLGHSQIITSQRYAHLSQETLLAAVDSAAEATGMDWTDR